MPRFILVLALCLASLGWSWGSGWDIGRIPAKDVSTDKDNFTKNLSATDTTVQKALETLDQMAASGVDSTLYVTKATTLTINGTTQSLAASRTWNIDSMVYPGAGIAVSTGSAWGTSIADASSNWNTAYTDRMKWDGGSTGLNAATARSSLELGTAAQSAATDFQLSLGYTPANIVDLALYQPKLSYTPANLVDLALYALLSGANFTGNLGLGSSSPQQKLDVEGSIYVGASGNVGIGTQTTRQSLDVDGTVYMKGNVGVGTTAAKELLEVEGAVYLASHVPPATAWRLYNNAGTLQWNGADIGGGAASGWTTDSSSKTTTTYNVGIGTDAPRAGLDVEGTVYMKGNVGIGTAAPRALLEIGSSASVISGSSPDLIIKRDLSVDGTIYNNSIMFGAWATPTDGTTYRASTDGEVIAWLNGTNAGYNRMVYVNTDSSNPPATTRSYVFADWQTTNGVRLSTGAIPVKKNDYYTAGCNQGTGSGSCYVYWIPRGSY